MSPGRAMPQRHCSWRHLRLHASLATLPFHPRRGLRLSSRDACASEILKHIRRNQYIFNDGAGFQALSRMERNSWDPKVNKWWSIPIHRETFQPPNPCRPNSSNAFPWSPPRPLLNDCVTHRTESVPAWAQHEAELDGIKQIWFAGTVPPDHSIGPRRERMNLWLLPEWPEVGYCNLLDMHLRLVPSPIERVREWTDFKNSKTPWSNRYSLE